ncbi:chemotaxis protein CheD, partial [Candidatus Beckwithbacteria bacterium]|nr:chemotaxis protein CheD [Candidatus Beckwithbacteria bacterium]
LTSLDISIVAEHTGGTFGRSVAFDLGNGIVSIKSNI